MKSKYNILIFIIFQACFVFSQTDKQVSLIYFDHLSINPGYAGNENAIIANAIVRNQWLGFGEDGGAGASTQVLSVSTPVNFLGMKHGVGLNIINDQIGANSNTNLNLAYAYITKVGQGNMGIGLDLGFWNRKMDFSQLNPTTEDNIPTTEQTDMIFDLGLGVFYKTDNLYLGVSGKHLPPEKADYVGTDNTITEKISRHFYVTSGYTYQLTNPLFEIQPSVHLKSGGNKSQVTYGTRVLYNKKFWGGVSYNHKAGINILYGMELPSGFEFAVAYEIPLAKVHAAGSVEFMLGYRFNLSVEKTTPSYKSVRFL